MTKIFVQSLGSVAARFLIGLSATPYRNDGMDELFEVYFASSKTCIHRPLRRHHYHYVHTAYINVPARFPERVFGRWPLLWNRILDQQSFHAERIRWIGALCDHFQDRRILILGKRIEALRLLSEKITGSVVFTGSDTHFDTDAQILLSTFSKVGTGFSLTIASICSSSQMIPRIFLQYLGRVFRRLNVVPIVVDIVDRHLVLQNHYRTQKKVYRETVGEFHPAPPIWDQLVGGVSTPR